jgi:hypothetical protein
MLLIALRFHSFSCKSLHCQCSSSSSSLLFISSHCTKLSNWSVNNSRLMRNRNIFSRTHQAHTHFVICLIRCNQASFKKNISSVLYDSICMPNLGSIGIHQIEINSSARNTLCWCGKTSRFTHAESCRAGVTIKRIKNN